MKNSLKNLISIHLSLGLLISIKIYELPTKGKYVFFMLNYKVNTSRYLLNTNDVPRTV